VATAALEGEIQALDDGRAVLDLDGWTLTEVRGADAERWLNDLVTASTEGIADGEAVRSLLLSPTGKIRADFHVVRSSTGEGFLLLQGPAQPDALATLLRPYVLSADVELAEADPTGLMVTPGPGPRWTATRDRPGKRTRVQVAAEAFEAWRIRHGIARFPVDLDADSLPAEAGLDVEPLIDRTKGCYLGQESVARVRNLGHPPRVVLAVRVDGPLQPGLAVFSEGAQAGTVTSVEPNGGSGAMVRIRWDAREADLTAAGGGALQRR
jgi:tRNA-modifying protein YgfZ